jgi:hypothetical protein
MPKAVEHRLEEPSDKLRGMLVNVNMSYIPSIRIEALKAQDPIKVKAESE